MILTVTLNTCIDKVVAVPGFVRGGTMKGRVRRFHPAGKCINVSRCLAVLGHASIASGFVGRNEHPLFSDELARHNIADHLVDVDGRTRDSVTYIDPDDGTVTHIREDGAPVGRADLDRLAACLAERTGRGDTVIFAGSMPPGLQADALGQLLTMCRQAGARTVLDSSGEAFVTAVKSGPWLIKPNQAELNELTGLSTRTTAEVVSAAKSLLDKVEIVVASMGRNGAVCVTNDGAWHGAGDVDGVRSTVGCGDALLAGFIAGLAEDLPLAECLRKGVACGAASARSDVAGEIHADHVRELLPFVKVFPIQ